MVAETDKTIIRRNASRASGLAWLSKIFLPIRRLLGHYVFSSLTRRILVLNLAALAVLVTGILYLNQFREGLIDARVESLMTQGEIIAAAIAASASVSTDAITVDPEKLLELQAGQTISPTDDSIEAMEFPINPERVAPLLRRLISPTRTRARIYDRDANLMLDSQHLYAGGQVLRFNLPPVANDDESWLETAVNWFGQLFKRSDLPIYQDSPGGNGAAFPEVMTALTGGASTIVRMNEQGGLVVSIAVPVQRFRAVLGVLQLSTQGSDIDRIVQAERLAIVRVFAVAVFATGILSMLLASTIANPLRRLAAAAVRVRRGVRTREEIPDFSDRQDEIGNLSIALRDMTSALYARIEAIESFAADVSHELKNPLTSLRSAVETLPVARTPESQKKLMDVIQHDVRRLDRLITDISDASRLDAELARQDAQKVDLKALLTNLVSGAAEMRRDKKVSVTLEVAKLPTGVKSYVIPGHDLRIGQVVTNLIENARSFVTDGTGRIKVSLEAATGFVRVLVEDNGPGITSDNIDRIFERFYTDRPSVEAFGQNSGLGLSISRQIIQAHGGSINAENILDAKTGQVLGARFIVLLPIES
jgi:two-component system, OmpR family, sensor histidine kinase ChvG